MPGSVRESVHRRPDGRDGTGVELPVNLLILCDHSLDRGKFRIEDAAVMGGVGGRMVASSGAIGLSGIEGRSTAGSAGIRGGSAGVGATGGGASGAGGTRSSPTKRHSAVRLQPSDCRSIDSEHRPSMGNLRGHGAGASGRFSGPAGGGAGGGRVVAGASLVRGSP